MKEPEIKEKLIAEIKQVENVQLLEVLYKILTSREKEEYIINEEQILAIEEAREQYRKGEFLGNEEVDREIQQWLKK
ncbi:MAG: hypothetical protein WBL27_00185 [Salinimicrobium sp.]